jgi:mRNA-degrading endonuclease RelE of RelBE toxin-antitoxin system
MPYLIRYGASAQSAIRAMTARDRSTVLAGIRADLSDNPLHETRNRKPLRPTPAVLALGITWELRIAGVWRVFYSVDSEIVTVDVIQIARKGRETTEQLLASAEEDPETDT